jgi:hypothetical protein
LTLEQRRKKALKRFGLTPEAYDARAKEQGFACALCGQPETEKYGNKDTDKYGATLSLAVDHDHATGVIRGLLCRRCNRGLGVFGDDIELLSKAIQYLLKGKDLNAA